MSSRMIGASFSTNSNTEGEAGRFEGIPPLSAVGGRFSNIDAESPSIDVNIMEENSGHTTGARPLDNLSESDNSDVVGRSRANEHRGSSGTKELESIVSRMMIDKGEATKETFVLIHPRELYDHDATAKQLAESSKSWEPSGTRPTPLYPHCGETAQIGITAENNTTSTPQITPEKTPWDESVTSSSNTSDFETPSRFHVQSAIFIPIRDSSDNEQEDSSSPDSSDVQSSRVSRNFVDFDSTPKFTLRPRKSNPSIDQFGL